MNTMNPSIQTDISSLKMNTITMMVHIETDLLVIEECIVKAQFKISIIRKLITKSLSNVDNLVKYMLNQLWILIPEVGSMERIIITM